MPGMRTWILLSTFALALPLAACGDDTGGTGGGGGDDSSTSTGSGSTASGTPTTTGGASLTPPTLTHAACASAPAATIGTAATGLAFEPKTASIKAGESIQFESGTVTHTIKGSDWETDEGGTSCLTFSEAGSYPFVCGIHASMSGTITVTP